MLKVLDSDPGALGRHGHYLVEDGPSGGGLLLGGEALPVAGEGSPCTGGDFYRDLGLLGRRWSYLGRFAARFAWKLCAARDARRSASWSRCATNSGVDGVGDAASGVGFFEGCIEPLAVGLLGIFISIIG